MLHGQLVEGLHADAALGQPLHVVRRLPHVVERLPLAEGRPVWSVFNADRDQVLWYYRTTIDRCGAGDPRLERLAESCRVALAVIEAPGSLPADS